jgi:hypothetical protein
MPARYILIIVGVSATVAFCGGCRRKVAAESRDVRTVCLECRQTGTARITGPLEQQTWPRACPACSKPAAYPAGNPCINCGKPVPLRDPATGGYGYPPRCPFCKRKWEA